jgi:FkbM family methyltransferase
MNSVKHLVRQLILLPAEAMELMLGAYLKLWEKMGLNFGFAWKDKFLNALQSDIGAVSHHNGDKHIELKFFMPNQVCRYRVDSFSSKEPETLNWIDESPPGSVLYDIGANIGLYSVYHALSKNANVYAFEPSFLNLALLAKNLTLNHVSDKVKVIVNPLTASNMFAQFNLSSLVEGGALSAFGVDYGQDGRDLDKKLTYQTLGFSLDFLLENGILTEPPNMIKIDVDGIEHLILQGARRTLQSPACRTVLIEVSLEFKEQANGIQSILTECGFSQVDYNRVSHAAQHPDQSIKNQNQIWIKK